MPAQRPFPDRCFPHFVRLRRQSRTADDAIGGEMPVDDESAGEIWQALVLNDKEANYAAIMGGGSVTTNFFTIHLRSDPGLIQDDQIDWVVDPANSARDMRLNVDTPGIDATGDDYIFKIGATKTS